MEHLIVTIPYSLKQNIEKPEDMNNDSINRLFFIPVYLYLISADILSLLIKQNENKQER